MSNENNDIKDRLKDIDFCAAAEMIKYTLREGVNKAKSEGNYMCMRTEYIEALERYLNNPNLDEALILLESYPEMIELFEFTKDPLQVWARNFKGSDRK
jgi:hypothetical protein